MNLLNVGYFRLARNVSKYSNHRVKVGAVVCNKRPIGIACNVIKTHPIYTNNSIRNSIHAEIRAVINGGKFDLNGGTIFIYRETKKGMPAYARPCENCLTFLKECGIRKVYYTTNELPFFAMEKI